MTMTHDHIQKASRILADGGVVVYPTDTAFGIGCRIDDRAAVDRLFALRKRPVTQATPVLVATKEMALAYCRSPSDIVRHLMDRYWPGALTIIADCDPDVIYSPIRGGSTTIGLRMPNHDGVREIISTVGVPIIGTSANFHGGKTPYETDDLDPALVALVDYVVPGVCVLKQASTVVDCSADPYVVVRQGSVHLKK